MFDDLFILQGQVFYGFIVKVPLDLQFRPELSVDLDHEGDVILMNEIFVVIRPRLLKDVAIGSDFMPDLFSDVRDKW